MPAANDQHYEWFNLIEIAGPFLAIPVLNDVFPQGLPPLEKDNRNYIRQFYEVWTEIIEANDSRKLKVHREWILTVMKDALEYGEELKVDASSFTSPWK